MDELITSFGIDFDKLHEILKNDQSIIVGGAPLACLLKQHGVDPGFEPRSINIFMPTGIAISKCYEDSDDDELEAAAHRLQYFLETQGFTEGAKYDFNLGALAQLPIANRLLPVGNFTKDGKTIRIITVDCYNIEVYVKRSFNLSVGLCWWNPDTSRGYQSYIETIDLERTLCKEMYVLPTAVGKYRNSKPPMQNVVDKYIERGFTLIESP